VAVKMSGKEFKAFMVDEGVWNVGDVDWWMEEDVISALVNLGYQRPAAEKALLAVAAKDMSELITGGDAEENRIKLLSQYDDSIIEARIASGQAPAFHAQWWHGEGKEKTQEATCTAHESRCAVRAGGAAGYCCSYSQGQQAECQ